MKKLALVALAAATMVSTPAFADNSDTTTLSATIDANCNLDAPNNASVNLNGPTEIGNLRITCNDAQGFLFSLSSRNGFELEAEGSTSKVPYTLSSPLFPGTGRNSDIENQPVPAARGMWVAGRDIPVIVNANLADPAYAGVYTDTLTWTITAN